MLSLFALTNDPHMRIVKFAISNPVQADLTSCMKDQESSFDEATTAIAFDGKYKPDEGEVLYIENFDDIDGLRTAIENPLVIAEAIPTEEFFKTIKALFTGYTKDNGKIKVLIQNFDRRKILSTSGLSIFHSGNTYRKVDGIGLTIDYKLSAIIDEDRLKFFSFHTARQIFDLSDHYKTATDEDVREFAMMENFHEANPEELIAVSDSWIRRKITLIKQSGILQSVPINEMKAIALDFNIPFDTTLQNGTELIIIPQPKAELKKLLRFLDEDYYKSPLSKTNFITNSRRRAD